MHFYLFPIAGNTYRVSPQSINNLGECHGPNFFEIWSCGQPISRVQNMIFDNKESKNSVDIRLVADDALMLKLKEVISDVIGISKLPNNLDEKSEFAKRIWKLITSNKSGDKKSNGLVRTIILLHLVTNFQVFRHRESEKWDFRVWYCYVCLSAKLGEQIISKTERWKKLKIVFFS